MGLEDTHDVDSLLGDPEDPERRLWELEQFKTVIERFPEPVLITDQSGYLTYANPAFGEQLGYDPAEDLHVSDFVRGDDVDEVLAELRTMATGEDTATESGTVTLHVESADGRTLIFETSIALLPGDTEFSGAALTFRDVTLKRRRDEVFEVMDRTLRHNLRNTVSVITTSTGILENRVEEDEVLENIHESGMKLQAIGDRLRTLRSAIDESFQRDESMPVAELVSVSVDRGRPDNDAADVTTHFSATGELEAPRPVEVALKNIIENAIVHNDTDAPTVEIWVTHSPVDGWIDVHVEDDGPGIPSFERDIVLGNTAPDQLQHGSGLGLWIARWVVEIVGGTLELEDNEPRGSVVTLRLPLSDEPGTPG